MQGKPYDKFPPLEGVWFLQPKECLKNTYGPALDGVAQLEYCPVAEGLRAQFLVTAHT